ncbi:hypothetical protein NDU88_002561 [Pleurodeles waltl]|uniref:Uncharacterized protein n=1 Tax=Pleurodeles waltl TaxID=8319 RepID=A0AAV7LG17_PLEWA|nr:hypothetical protein NDU88_002561 [Pleurodeles waltl]
MDVEVPITLLTSLLEVVRRARGCKIPYEIAQLTLLLAKRRVAIGQMSERLPHLNAWLCDVCEWGAAEKAHMCLTHTNEKAEDEIMTWGLVLNNFPDDGDTSPSDGSENDL